MSRVVEDFERGRKQGSELTSEDVGRTLTLYLGRERAVTEEEIGLRVYLRGDTLQLEEPEQRDVRKGLVPADRVLAGHYCSGCAAKGDDPDCSCGGLGWRTFNDGIGPHARGTVAELTAIARNDWAKGI